ncbi:MAG: GIY-YIG nuclease family protein [Fulvivirga sp.]|uniref:GIY-YIG nuclease family protein n=1 Tax=Fulvivirga sp. TaxID=1931237 RepID=UPI0032EEF5A1
MHETRVFNVFNGFDQAYIYIWISKTHKVVYVGMTNGYTGTIGRANGHFNRTGQLRKRFNQYRGYEVNEVDDMILLSFPLPKKKEYMSVERSYREAVEYLVQKELIQIRGILNPTFDVISWVRDSPRIGNAEVRKIATQIVSSFSLSYNRL